MQHILHAYQLRLTNLSQANRSLRLGRLSPRRDVDLMQLGFIDKLGPEDILTTLIAAKPCTLLTRPDPRREAANLADRRLNNIFRQAEAIMAETGRYDLALGYPFVEGRFVDGAAVRCPVLLFHVRLRRNLGGRPRWKLEPDPATPPQFNRSFFLAYEWHQQHRLGKAFWDAELPRAGTWQDLLLALYDLIKLHEVDVNFNQALFQYALQSLPDFSRETMREWPLGKLTFQPQAVLGLFPQSDSALLQDYETLTKSPQHFPMLARLAGQDVQPPTAPEPWHFRFEGTHLPLQLDDAQEAALVALRSGASIALHGPPGTGKSQVIVNVITDYAARGKRVLLVSHKRAALDVVAKRLQAIGLGNFAMLVHDHRQDRQAVYAKLRAQIEATERYRAELQSPQSAEDLRAYTRTCRQADADLRLAQDLRQALTTPTPQGPPPHQLYERILLIDPDHARPLPHDCQAQADALAFAHTDDTLAPAIEQVLQLLQYRPCFHQDYPWKLRKPTHDLPDPHATAEAIRAIPAQAQDLAQRFDDLARHAGTAIQHPDTAQHILRATDDIHATLHAPGAPQALALIHLSPKSPHALEATLNAAAAIIAQRAQGQLPRLPQTDTDALIEHLAAYAQHQANPLKLFNRDFRHAERELQYALQQQGLPLNDDTLRALRDTALTLRDLERIFANDPFWQDLPLQAPHDTLRRWAEAKRAHLHAYRRIAVAPLPKAWALRWQADGQPDMHAWATTQQYAQGLRHWHQAWQQTRDAWAQLLHPDQMAQAHAWVTQPGHPQPRLLAQTFQRDALHLRHLDALLHTTDTRAQDLARALAQHPDITPDQALQHRLHASAWRAWLRKAEAQNPLLQAPSLPGFETRRQHLATLAAHIRTQAAHAAETLLKRPIAEAATYNRLGNPASFRNILHQASKKRNLLPLRRLVAEAWHDGLQALAPIWMASPESAAAIFPMRPDLFDLVIFDEASQCFVERGIPAALRGAQLLIAGDEQQLRPSSLYAIRHDDPDEDPSDIPLDVESLLDLARRTLPGIRLRWHYRSQHPALIAFSNAHFYDHALACAPMPPPRAQAAPQPLVWVPVQGQWHHQQNRPEAQAVIQQILQIIQRPDRPSLGVITFNYPQQELIKDLLDDTLQTLAKQDPPLHARLAEALAQTEGEEFVGLFIKNIENVQGDERDVILFSIAYAPDDAGKLAAQFGTLNQAGGANRLNVAVTRARQQIIVVCSFAPTQLHTDATLHPGPKLLKAYLQAVFHYHHQAQAQHPQSPEPTPHAQAQRPIVARLQAILQAQDTPAQSPLQDAQSFHAPDPGFDLRLTSPPENVCVQIADAHYLAPQNPRTRELYTLQALQARGWEVRRLWPRNLLQPADGGEPPAIDDA